AVGPGQCGVARMVHGPCGSCSKSCGSSEASGNGTGGRKQGPKVGGRRGRIEGAGLLREGNRVPNFGLGDTEPQSVIPEGEAVYESSWTCDALRKVVRRHDVGHRVQGRNLGRVVIGELRGPNV